MFYIFIVAVANIGLGFGVAVYLGRRCRPLTAEADPTQADTVSAQAATDVDPPEEGTQTAAVPLAEPVPPLVTGPLEPEATQLESGKTPSQACAEDFQVHVQNYHQQLAQADTRLREQLDSPDAAAIEACLSSLMAAIQEYVDSRDASQTRFCELHGQQPWFDAAADRLQAAAARQDAQIAITSAAIEAFDFEQDLAGGCRGMISQTNTLISDNYRLRDALEEAVATVAREENWPPASCPTTQADDPAQPAGQTQLEASIAEWLQRHSTDDKQLAVLIVDVDHLAQVNEQHGYQAGERVLHTVAQLILAGSTGRHTLARLSGGRFCCTFANADATSAASVAEQLRQEIEIAHFQFCESDIQITVSCAVAVATCGDTPELVLQRAQTALQEAKRSGCNRTFVHNGNSPSPVVLPSSSLQEKQISI
jgi:diguanylate cyclase (GGDEF)-like protein